MALPPQSLKKFDSQLVDNIEKQIDTYLTELDIMPDSRVIEAAFQCPVTQTECRELLSRYLAVGWANSSEFKPNNVGYLTIRLSTIPRPSSRYD